MKKPIYRWKDEYFGFLYNNRLFDKNSNYLGWIDEDEVWRKDGIYLGNLVAENYILKKRTMATKARRAIRAIPATPARPSTKANRAAKAQKAGYVDALMEFE